MSAVPWDSSLVRVGTERKGLFYPGTLVKVLGFGQKQRTERRCPAVS